MEEKSVLTKHSFINDYEKEKAKLKLPVIFFSVFLLFGAVSIAGIFLVFQEVLDESFFVAATFLAFLSLIGAVVCIPVFFKIKSKVKKKFELAAVSTALERTFFGAKYLPYGTKTSLTESEIHRVFNLSFNAYSAEFYMTAFYKRRRVNLIFVTNYLHTGAFENESFVPVLKGLWFAFELENAPSFELFLYSQNILDKLSKAETILTENEEFNKRFSVRSDNEGRAKAFLSDSVTTFLLEKTREKRGDFSILISKKGYLHIAMETGEYRFKPDGEKGDLESAAEKILPQIKFFTDIADGLISKI